MANHTLPTAVPARHKQWRKWWLNIHLYVGLSVGLVLALAGLTGSLLVFYVELDEMLNPHLQIAAEAVQPTRQSYEQLLHSIQAAHPTRTGAWRLELPRHPQAMLMARYYKPIEKTGLSFAPLIAWVNPYTGEWAGSRFWGEFVMTWLFDLHYALLLDELGKTLMAITGGVLVVGLLSGLYLWWPSAKKLKAALSIKRGASAERLVFDIHKTQGVYSFIILMLLLLSGVLLELPKVFKPIIHSLSPLYQSPVLQSADKPGAVRIPLDQAAAIAQRQFPDAVLRWLETPDSRLGVYRIMLYQAGEPSLRFPKTTVWLDQYSGAVLSIRNPRLEHSGDTLLNWLHPLHNGEIAGLFGRWVVFASGLVPAVLYVTGFMRWRQKCRAKRTARS